MKKFYNGIPNVTLWRVLRKRLHLKAYKISIFQGVEWWIVCTPLSVNVFEHSSHSNIWNTIVQLFFQTTLHYQWKSLWTVTIPGGTQCVLLYYDSSKHCTSTRPLNKNIQVFKVVKFFFETPRTMTHCLGLTKKKSCWNKTVIEFYVLG
jgi:hypothetical protein